MKNIISNYIEQTFQKVKEILIVFKSRNNIYNRLKVKITMDTIMDE